MNSDAAIKSCKSCRKYDHYSENHPDENKRGKIIIANGSPLRRPARDLPDCNKCIKADMLNIENKELFNRYQLLDMGICLNVDKSELPYFLIIKREIEKIKKQQQLTTNAQIIKGLIYGG